MMEVTVFVTYCLLPAALASIHCTDWLGKAIAEGEDFYPKREDPCYLCRCEGGFFTMCKTVSCAPPSCEHWKQISGKCCEFKCISPEVRGDNSTKIPSFGGDVAGSPTDSTMTDLGLRLVASTVTTFLILALLLFLIYRLRQRHVLMTLRRYRHRQEHLDDSDNISYSPDFYRVQCPPYPDPPPPYTPPKPPHILNGEQPPPYEAIDSNGNNNQNTTSFICTQECQNETNQENVRGVPNRDISAGGSDANNGRVNSVGNSDLRNTPSSPQHVEVGENVSFLPHNLAFNDLCSAHNLHSSTPNRHSMSVHFRNSSSFGQPSIAMGVQNRGRNNRNRFSDGSFNLSPIRNVNSGRSTLNESYGLNLELRNTIHNMRNDIRSRHSLEESHHRHSLGNGAEDQSSSTTDIGESSTSAESLESSPNFSPESPDAETEVLKSFSQQSLENQAEDADTTVKQFMDRQFGPLSKVRRYPTTMSQSWTSALHNSAAPNFKQSHSLGSFLVNQDDGRQRNEMMNSDVTVCATTSNQLIDGKGSDRQLLRSKSEQLKTNGSLRSQPYKGVVRSQTSLPQQVGTGFAARVSYVEPEESFQSSEMRQQGSSSNQNGSSSYADCYNLDSTVSECSSSDLNGFTGSHLDPGDIIVTRRQDVLRELRLSHLLHNPVRGYDSSDSPITPPGSGRRTFVQSHVSNCENGVVSSCSENTPSSQSEVVIGNDAQYPDMPYKQFTNTSASSSPLSDDRRSRGGHSKRSNSSVASNVSENTFVKDYAQDTMETHSNSEAKISNSAHSSPAKQSKINSLKNSLPFSMSHSWHGKNIESSDENIGQQKTDTLGRNVNTNIEKKTCFDKDVSNLFFPTLSGEKYDFEYIGKGVPSSNMRACASQMYNCEAEDTAQKKDKKKHFLKRHSAGCFPSKHESASGDSNSPPLGPKLSQKSKSSHGKERQLIHRYSDGYCDRKGKSSTGRDKKSHGHTLGHGVSCSNKSRQYQDHTVPKVTDLTPSCLVHTSLSTPITYLGPKAGSKESAEHTDMHGSRRIRMTYHKGDKRSKSLGRNEGHHSGQPEKRSDTSTSRRSQGRKKKSQNHQSFCGTQSFHKELEHVLQSQKLCAMKSPSKSMNKSETADGSHCAL